MVDSYLYLVTNHQCTKYASLPDLFPQPYDGILMGNADWNLLGGLGDIGRSRLSVCPVSAPKSVRGFLGRLKVSLLGGHAEPSLAVQGHIVELVNTIITDAQAGDMNLFVYIYVSIRTQIPVLTRPSYIVNGVIVIFDRLPQDGRSPYPHVPGGNWRWFVVCRIDSGR
ncbi:hypothetical protein THAOC_01967 [Thalassiosira oceanica]|uniref:Uncharacterized protein n=1 Tax=Thalassiosira oceanica TaxID=159749 RepID=K0TGZ2_THAOC|nr:hypothetical protein THAOC_01967 [Thalassiosira oceanica]|eukprot:EJK76279.1 hypothetical protein THAOC_01967 [Thalassiosira oceanica]